MDMNNDSDYEYGDADSSEPSHSHSHAHAHRYQPSNNKRNLKWEQRYEELKQYKSMHGNVNVPQTYKDNLGLGRWVRRQRVECAKIVHLMNVNNANANANANPCDYDYEYGYECDDLTRYRIEKLLHVGFVFDLKNDIWNMRLKELDEFKKLNGHLRVPQHYKKGHKWYKLGLWVRNQRAMYNRLILNNDPQKRAGIHSHGNGGGDGAIDGESESESESSVYNFLTEERIQLLNNVGFCWDAQDENWMEHYEKLKRFWEINGHSDVPSRYRGDPSLSRWVQQQRGHGRGYGNANTSTSTLPPERLELLDQLDFVWENKNDLHWWNNYDTLCKYKERYGNCIVPLHYDDYKLYNWVNNTKRKFKEFGDMVTLSNKNNGKLSIDDGDYSAVPGLNRERIEALIKIDFCWLPIDINGDMVAKPSEPTRQKRTKKPKPKPTPQSRNVNQPSKPGFVPLTPPPPKKKEFIPFPWDEI